MARPRKPEDAKDDIPFTPPPDVKAHLQRPKIGLTLKQQKKALDDGMSLAPIDRIPITEYKSPRCGKPLSVKSTKRGDGVCRMPAGWNTDHLGDGPCSVHGGNRKQTQVRLVREMIMENIKQGIYGDPTEIDPDTALLMEVHRTAGHVEWLRMHIREIGERKGDRVLTQYTDAFGIGPSVWVDMYQKERAHLVRVAKAAIDAGVAVRQVEVAENQARLMAMVMIGFIEDADLGLDYLQKLNARKLMRKHLEDANGIVMPELPEVVEVQETMDAAILEDNDDEEVF